MSWFVRDSIIIDKAKAMSTVKFWEAAVLSVCWGGWGDLLRASVVVTGSSQILCLFVTNSTLMQYQDGANSLA